MKKLLRQKRIFNINILNQFIMKTVFFGMLAYYLVEISLEPFSTQLIYIASFSALSLAIDFIASRKTKASEEVILDNGRLIFLSVDIDISTISEILYVQTKRFEHTVRFRFKNQTYQDFELASPDLIEDLRFYKFLVENQLPIKMLDSDERIA
ncbi:hypothetical protein [Vibrio nereis]|uniref:Uncharacterized protein n=1 Tax=Vibrio nereis TaxID=693 RepID=A0A0M0HQC4_VIBNE|nr:hypothetical protein [Vibrio nereis]KOO04241.1 hypothetical protein AKJ17_04855 [Vibrio nereis]